MRKQHLGMLLGLVSSMTIGWPGSLRGQDAATTYYGDGVRAFFAGNCSRAEQSLSDAMALNSQDPRVYYFRALSLLRLGRLAEARGDMQVGAGLEAQNPGRYAIGTALERVQGRDRLMLEQFRREARLQNASAVSTGSVPTMNANQLREPLRRRVVIPLDEYLRPGAPQPVGGTIDRTAPRTFAPAPTDDPFRDDPLPPTRIPATAPPGSAPQPSAGPSTPPTGDDPFAGNSEPAVEDSTSPNGADANPPEPPSDGEDDPFSS